MSPPTDPHADSHKHATTHRDEQAQGKIRVETPIRRIGLGSGNDSDTAGGCRRREHRGRVVDIAQRIGAAAKVRGLSGIFREGPRSLSVGAYRGGALVRHDVAAPRPTACFPIQKKPYQVYPWHLLKKIIPNFTIARGEKYKDNNTGMGKLSPGGVGGGRKFLRPCRVARLLR